MKHAAVGEYKRKRWTNIFNMLYCNGKIKLPGSQQQLAMTTHIKVTAVLYLFHSQQRPLL
jgi:hypothetical protein